MNTQLPERSMQHQQPKSWLQKKQAPDLAGQSFVPLREFPHCYEGVHQTSKTVKVLMPDYGSAVLLEWKKKASTSSGWVGHGWLPCIVGRRSWRIRWWIGLRDFNGRRPNSWHFTSAPVNCRHQSARQNSHWDQHNFNTDRHCEYTQLIVFLGGRHLHK